MQLNVAFVPFKADFSMKIVLYQYFRLVIWTVPARGLLTHRTVSPLHSSLAMVNVLSMFGRGLPHMLWRMPALASAPSILHTFSEQAAI